jgi:hypothetical protein
MSAVAPTHYKSRNVMRNTYRSTAKVAATAFLFAFRCLFLFCLVLAMVVMEGCQVRGGVVSWQEEVGWLSSSESREEAEWLSIEKVR